MAYQLQEINRRIQTDVQAFLAECDGNYSQRVSLAADKILSNLEKSPIVLLSGPSGSGKTTTAMKIAEELKRRGVNTHAVAMDNYFHTINPRTAPRCLQAPRSVSVTRYGGSSSTAADRKVSKYPLPSRTAPHRAKVNAMQLTAA